ncbi:MAG TPA: hypothetical protein VM871_06520, partial [Flavisolibacter sp.]|nr:hypothetical protein [Flavisolibacter sp.]
MLVTVFKDEENDIKTKTTFIASGVIALTFNLSLAKGQSRPFGKNLCLPLMRKSPFLFFLFLLCLTVFWSSIPTGCANIIPPSGGPRDSLPPRLVSALPRDSTLNFRGDRITFI